jgi:hypothetical protein
MLLSPLGWFIYPSLWSCIYNLETGISLDLLLLLEESHLAVIKVVLGGDDLYLAFFDKMLQDR